MWLYVLNEVKKPILADSFDVWVQWLQKNMENRTVASTELDDGTYILTVFLAHSTPFSDKQNPQTFQTMIVGGDHHMKERYYTSWESAEKGHEEVVAAVLADNDPIWPEDIELPDFSERLMDFYGVIL